MVLEHWPDMVSVYRLFRVAIVAQIVSFTMHG